MQLRHTSLILLALGTGAAGVMSAVGGPSLCPDGGEPAKEWGAPADPLSTTYVCCPGILNFGGGAASDITCSAGCDYLTETICGSTTFTTPVSVSATATTHMWSITAAPSTACLGSSCPTPLPLGCSTSVKVGVIAGVCNVVPWTASNYLSQLYGTAAGTATFGAPPSNSAALRGMEKPIAALVAGALAGIMML